MANPTGKCVVCGASPTVKAHLFPRALMLDLRDGGAPLVEGSRHRDGIEYRQNGTWDDRYLCKAHEDLCGAGDEYAVQLCRRLDCDARPIEQGKGFAVPNPRPALLVHFAYAMVWRQVACLEGHKLGLDLGPYRARLEAVLFGGAAADLQLLVGRSGLVAGNLGPARVAIAPYRQKLGPWRVWHFAVGGLDFYLKTDRRPFPGEWAPYLANGSDPLQLPTTGPLELAGVPFLRDTFERMQRRG